MQDEDDDPSKKVFHGTNRCTALTTLRHLEGGRARTMAAAATEAASSSSPSFCSWTIKTFCPCTSLHLRTFHHASRETMQLISVLPALIFAGAPPSLSF